MDLEQRILAIEKKIGMVSDCLCQSCGGPTHANAIVDDVRCVVFDDAIRDEAAHSAVKAVTAARKAEANKYAAEAYAARTTKFAEAACTPHDETRAAEAARYKARAMEAVAKARAAEEAFTKARARAAEVVALEAAFRAY